MSDAIITVENLGKKYQIVHEKARRGGTTLRETLTSKGAGLIRALIPGGRRRNGYEGGGPPRREEFWALRNVGFEVKQGEVVGIIGRNGAGKSTLLKILSRITEPTEGRVTIKGRVASLLEVGTGFHPELTGRENVYLNGAILGMTRSEIKRKFDEIIDFAGVEKFLDTPVKRYSSGMYVRLAFAVAAHLDPEILIVDEVLAVGDAEFQKKCLGKISEAASGGRTVLFVSHNMSAVEHLCTRATLLITGRVAASGPVVDVIRKYLASSNRPTTHLDLREVPNRVGAGDTRITEVTVWGRNRNALPRTGDSLNILLRFGGHIEEARPSRVSIAVNTALGTPLIVCSTEMTVASPPLVASGDALLCNIPSLPLTEGEYGLTLFLEQNGVIQDWLSDVSLFGVENADFHGHGRNVPNGHEGKTVLVKHSWESVTGEPIGLHGTLRGSS